MRLWANSKWMYNLDLLRLNPPIILFNKLTIQMWYPSPKRVVHNNASWTLSYVWYILTSPTRVVKINWMKHTRPQYSIFSAYFFDTYVSVFFLTYRTSCILNDKETFTCSINTWNRYHLIFYLTWGFSVSIEYTCFSFLL